MNTIALILLVAGLFLLVTLFLSGLLRFNSSRPDPIFDHDREFTDADMQFVCTDCGSADVLYVAPLLCGCCHIKRVEISRGCEIAGLTSRRRRLSEKDRHAISNLESFGLL